MASRQPVLQEVRICVEQDESPDTSHLGTYNSTGHLDPSRVVDRAARGDQARGTYRFFVAAMSPTETGNPDSVEQDYQRMEALNAGHWHYLGLWAEATVLVPFPKGNGFGGTLQRIRSGGLWGIESDIDTAVLEDFARQELSDLRGQLEAFGIKLPARLVANRSDRPGDIVVEA